MSDAKKKNNKSYDELDYGGCTRLAIAICETAANDYRRAYKKAEEAKRKRENYEPGSRLYDTNNLEYRANRAKIKSIERFFRSARGDILSFGNGGYIIEQLNAELRQNDADEINPRRID